MPKTKIKKKQRKTNNSEKRFTNPRKREKKSRKVYKQVQIKIF